MTRNQILTGGGLIASIVAALLFFEWSIAHAVEYSRFTAFWVGVTQLTFAVWAVDVLVLRRWSITDALFNEKNTAVAVVVAALIIGGGLIYSGT